MTVPGHSRRFDSLPVTSDLPRGTDIIGPHRLVRLVPDSDFGTPNVMEIS